MERRDERHYRRKPLYEWAWPYWLATVGVLGLLLAVFLASAVRLAGETTGFFRILGYTLGLAGFPCGCVLFWWWYRALHEEEQVVITVEPALPEPEEAERPEPILVKTLGPPQLEAPKASDPEVLIFLIRELWDREQLSRREVMGLRLPSGSKVSRSMWEWLIGGYRDRYGREKPGLLAAAGLVVRTLGGSWAWREGVTWDDVLACFDWGAPQIEAPAEVLGDEGESVTCAQRWLDRNRGRLDIRD